MDRDRIILYCDRIIVLCLCFSVFSLPFTKAGAETFVWTAFFIWLSKKGLGFGAGQGSRGVLPKTGLNKPIAVFIAINALSMIFSIDFGLSLRGFFGKQLKFAAIYFMLAEVINSKERLRNVLIAIIASAALIIADAGVQYFRGIDFLRRFPFERLRASFPSANGFGGWLILIIPIFLGTALSKKTPNIMNRTKRFFLLALAGLSVVCLVLTYSRGAWVGFLIGTGIFFFYYCGNLVSLKRKVLVFSAAAVFLTSAFFVMPHMVKDRIKSIPDINSNAIRVELWQEAVDIIEDFPVLGSGLNTYSTVAKHYKSFEGGGTYPHNSFLQMAAETGILGLVFFGWILAAFFKSGFRIMRERNDLLLLGLLTGIVAFLTQSFFDTHLYSLQLVVLFWFMIGLTTAVMRLEPYFSRSGS